MNIVSELVHMSVHFYVTTSSFPLVFLMLPQALAALLKLLFLLRLAVVVVCCPGVRLCALSLVRLLPPTPVWSIQHIAQSRHLRCALARRSDLDIVAVRRRAVAGSECDGDSRVVALADLHLHGRNCTVAPVISTMCRRLRK